MSSQEPAVGAVKQKNFFQNELVNLYWQGESRLDQTMPLLFHELRSYKNKRNL